MRDNHVARTRKALETSRPRSYAADHRKSQRHNTIIVVLVATWFVPACSMPPTQMEVSRLSSPVSFVQVKFTSSQTSQSNVSATFLTPQSSGNLNVVVVSWNDATSNVTSIVDTAGNNYRLATGTFARSTTAPASTAIYYASNIVGGTNAVTATFSGAVLYPEVIIAEYSGVDPVNPFDVGSAASGSSTTSDTGFANTANANELIVAANYLEHSSLGAGPNFTSRVITDDKDILEDRIATTPGSYNATVPLNLTGWWMSTMAAFRPAVPPDSGLPEGGAADASIDARFDTGSDTAIGTDTVTDAIADSSSDGATQSTPAFPLLRAAGKRYLVDQNGTPFLILGDSPWALFTALSAADARTYLDDARSRGVTSLLIEAIDNEFMATPTGGNANGDLPFTTALDHTPYTNARTQSPDFSTPNPAYWNHVDTLMSLVRSEGFLVQFYPFWIGNPINDPNQEGYYNALNAQSSGVRRGYGAFVGNRYRDYPNLIWVVGGDNNPANSAIVTDIVAGIQSVAGLRSTVFSFDGIDGSSPLTTTERWPASFVADGINNIYTDILVGSGNPYTYQQARSEWQRTDYPEVPYFQKEGTYQNEHNAPAQLVRAQTWQAMLGGACGYHWGSSPLWYFGAGWQSELSSRGALDMQVVNTFFKTRRWDLLVPDWGNQFLANGGSYSNATFVSAALASDATWGAMYVPRTEAITANLSAFSGAINAHWVDPTSGAMTNVNGSPFSNSGTVNLTPPSNNSTGDSDWVLLFDPSSANVDLPTIAIDAAASPNPVGLTTTALSVLGGSTAGEATLSYAWTETSGPATVSFAPNGTNAAKNSVATFTQIGAYTLQVTVTDSQGRAATSTVNVTVNQSVASIVVSPQNQAVLPGETHQFTAVAKDQFGATLSTQPPISWSTNAGGTVSAGGLFTAGSTTGGPFTVTATSNGTLGTATVTIGSISTVALSPVADAYVRDGSYSTTNFGTAVDLQNKNSLQDWNRNSYLTFDLSSATGTLQSARLRLFGAIGTAEQVSVSVFASASTNWAESNINWNNQPGVSGSGLASVVVNGTTAQWYEWDLTTYAQQQKLAGRNVITVVLENPNASTDYCDFHSREAPSNPPQLVVVYGP